MKIITNMLIKKISALTLESEEIIIDFEKVTNIDLSSAEKLHHVKSEIEQNGKNINYQNVSEKLNRNLTIFFK